MKKIAVVMESWVRYFTYAWPSGMLQKIREENADINLYIFNCSANWSSNPEYNLGEYNIYNLPDFNDYDGVVLDLNNTEDDGIREEVVERARRSGIPAISINNCYDGLYYVGIDNYSAMREMIAHLYEKHDCRTFWFIMGPESNYENKCRSDALLDYAKDKGISSDDYQICYGDFDFNSGVLSFLELYAEHGRLPDAIICANDNIAVGVLSEAEKKGYSAPEDFIITGFDDLDKSRYYTPRVSTTSYIREDAGYKSIEMFMELWKGGTIPQMNYTNSHPIFWESCGCESDIDIDLRAHLKGSMLWNIDREYFDGNVLALDYNLARCGNLESMVKCIPEGVPAFKCDGLYLVVDPLLEDINDSGMANIPMAELEDFESRFCVKGYPDEMTLLYSYENGVSDISNENRKKVHGMFPMFDTEEKGANFLFLPLHMGDKSVGYFVIRNAIYLMEQQFLFDIMNALIKGIEQMYEKAKLAKMNHELTMLYHHDAMTMLYNRFGYSNYAYKFFYKIHAAKKSVAVIYYDLDRLKYLNDNYGHEMGDMAIKTVAHLIRKYASDDVMGFRLGGDEFLVLDHFESEELLKERTQKIEDELKKISKADNYPIELSVSVGYIITDPESGEELESYVNQADDVMYKAKVAKKMQRRD
ncbi:MAG: GGDEF domain-containing protein [Lachnospiraceae bacterium]|nr:GGDEF domain-containing protein [Lachnospiraceae bacterium]